ncbi:DUF6685 family protein [Pseudomonas serbica]|uniref:DUF6685 family protein n=1 Tax=Pseudomonas serbica TaxID=2965074 RepID=UPI00237AFD91|nr:DUF6685 family protein [Pseudomonas serbica]
MTESTALTVQQFLEKHSPTPLTLTAAKDIVASSVTQWHNFGQYDTPSGKPGYLLGLRNENGLWGNLHECFYDIANFSVDEVERWEGDIRDLAGMTSSKYFLQGFDCLDRFVELNYPHLVEEISQESLSKALDDTDLRVLMSGEGVFRFYGWDNRMFLDGEVGIERLAAARYIAGKLNTKVPLTGAVQSHHISNKSVRGLSDDYELYAVAKSFELELDLFHTMREFGAPYFQAALPAPNRGTVILLPKHEPKSMAVAAQFAQADVTDLGLHLLALSSNQAFAPNT